MIKRKFGMKYLNISQGRYGNYSHKGLNAYDLAGQDSGIDVFRAYYQYEIIGILPFKETGFANTVLFYDKENDVSLALTHMNSIPSHYKIGYKFSIDEPMYYEGTTGKSTGNHVHMEIGKGRQTKKYYINGNWCLKDLINIEDYFYIDSNFTKVINDKGYAFSFRKEEAKVIVTDKYQKTTYLGQKLNIYKQNKNMEIGLISGDWKETKLLKDWDIDELITCRVNCSYFENRNNSEYGQVYGRQQGFNADDRPEQAEWLDCVITNNNELITRDLHSWEYPKNEVKVGFSPAAIMLRNGKDVEEYSIASGKGKITTANTQTLLVKFNDGFYGFIVVEGKLNLYQCRDFVKTIGCIDMIALDSGGSSQMVVDGKDIVNTGRKVPNVLIFYAKKEKPKEEIKEDTKELDLIKEEIKNLKTDVSFLKGYIDKLKEIFR